VPHLEDNMAVFPCANVYVTAIGVMTPPVTVLTAVVISDDNARATFTNNNFRGSRKYSPIQLQQSQHLKQTISFSESVVSL
jgi:hypothetical protein